MALKDYCRLPHHAFFCPRHLPQRTPRWCFECTSHALLLVWQQCDVHPVDQTLLLTYNHSTVWDMIQVRAASPCQWSFVYPCGRLLDTGRITLSVERENAKKLKFTLRIFRSAHLSTFVYTLLCKFMPHSHLPNIPQSRVKYATSWISVGKKETQESTDRTKPYKNKTSKTCQSEQEAW